MPTVSLTLDNVNKFIVTNSIYNIALEISEIIKVHNNLDIVTMYRGDEITVTDGKPNITTNRIDNVPTTISARRLVVNITDTYNEDALTTTATHQDEHYPIFADPDIDVTIFPIYIQTDYVIEFTFYTPSRNEIEKVVDDIRVRLSQTRNVFIHDIAYDYVLPEVVEDFIADVYANKSRLKPQPLADYFGSCSTRRIHLISDLVGGNVNLAVREMQTRVVGFFDFSPLPDKPEKDNNVYKFTFTYKFTLDKPTSLVMKYPVMVCNQLLPVKYMDFLVNREKLQEKNRPLSYSNSLYALSEFESHRELEHHLDITLPLNIPEIDDFKIKSIHKGYGILASFLTQIDETDQKTLLNLADLEPFYLDKDILAYIALERAFVTTPYSSFLYFGLYQEGRFFNMDNLELLSDNTLKAVTSLSLYKPTRVLLNYSLDVSSLNENATVRLLTYSDEIIVRVAQELVYTTTQYKTQAKDANEYSLYRFLTIILNELLKRQENAAHAAIPIPVNPSANAINTLLTQLYLIDIYTYTKFLSIIHGSYKETLFTPVKKSADVVKYYHLTDMHKDYESNVYTVMKTVQTSYIVAHRR